MNPFDPSPSTARVVALYCFTRIDDPAALKAALDAFCADRRLLGTLLIAPEGVNGTLYGRNDDLQALIAWLNERHDMSRAEIKFSDAPSPPFRRLKIRVKREIVTLGRSDIDPVDGVGRYVDPADWNALIDDPETVVIDTRNTYETRLGSFEGALDPETERFGDLPEWLSANRASLEGKRIAMFCTGGIRCEKATALLRQEGLDDVHHLKGGILAYLEQVPAENSRWAGDCFVFDERVAVGHGLEVGDHSLCRACRMPLTANDRADPRHEEGIACIHCVGKRSDDDRARYAERHRQERLAAERGRRHLRRP